MLGYSWSQFEAGVQAHEGGQAHQAGQAHQIRKTGSPIGQAGSSISQLRFEVF